MATPVKRYRISRTAGPQNNYIMLLLNDYLNIYAEKCPERPAVVSAFEEVTYGNLFCEVRIIAGYLKKLGLKEGDSIGILSRNTTSYLKLWYAAIRIGILTVNIHIRSTAEDQALMAGFPGCKYIFYSDEFKDRAEYLHEHITSVKGILYLDAFSHPGFFRKHENLSTDEMCRNEDSNAVLLYTSGTTGGPKGVIRTQHMLSVHAESLFMEEGFENENPAMLTASPFFHSAGILSAYRMLRSGGTLIMPERLDPPKVILLIKRYRPTSVHLLPPATYERIYDSGLWEGMDFSFVKEVCLSAGKCTMENINHIYEMFPECLLRPSWGATETGTVTSAHIRKDEIENGAVPVSSIIGKLMPFNEMRLVDEELKDVPDGAEGEALVRSDVTCTSYFNRKESREFLPGGWFRTGDILKYHSDLGYYEFMDRKKDIIKTGGENVCSLKVERAVSSYAPVKECAAVGISDRKLGEAIGIAIVLRDDTEDKKQAKGDSSPVQFNESDFLMVCHRYLSKMEMPRYILFLPELPKNGIGKIQKNALRKLEHSFRKIML